VKTIKILFVFLLVLFCKEELLAQDQRFIDSLQDLLRRHNAEKAELKIIGNDITDSIEVNLYYKLSQLYWSTSPKLAMDYANQCLYLAQKIGFKRGVGKAYNTLGVIHYNKGNFFEAIKYHKMALAIRTSLNDKRAMANSRNNIGNAYTLLSYFPEAIKEYFEALKIYEELKLEQPQATSFVNIGNIYLMQKNFSEAQKYYSKCLSINLKLGDKSGLAHVYLNLGKLFSDQGNSEKALENFSKSLNFFDDIGEKLTTVGCYNSIGVEQKKMGNYDLALKNFHQALKISQEFESKDAIIAAFGNIANTLTKLKKFQEAEQYLKLALNLAKEIGSLNYISLCYERFVELDSVKGNFKGALYNYRQFILYRDSITNTENSNKIVQTKMQYDFDKKEAAAKAAQLLKDAEAKTELQNQRLNNTLIASAAGILILLLLGFGYWRRSRYNLQVNKLENKTLRSQLNPHFIFNALASIQNYMNSKPELAENYLAKFGKLMREVLENSEKDSITLEDELAMLKKYMDLEALRVPNGFDYRIEVDESIDQEELRLPSFLLQPLVENAIWHGVANADSRGSIVIMLRRIDGFVNIAIENSAGSSSSNIPETKSETGKRKSFGMQIVRERLALLSKEKGRKGSLELVPGPNTMKAILLLPV
jgi:tetratricopeptide (TPR) repeat protein